MTTKKRATKRAVKKTTGFKKGYALKTSKNSKGEITDKALEESIELCRADVKLLTKFADDNTWSPMRLATACRAAFEMVEETMGIEVPSLKTIMQAIDLDIRLIPKSEIKELN